MQSKMRRERISKAAVLTLASRPTLLVRFVSGQGKIPRGKLPLCSSVLVMPMPPRTVHQRSVHLETPVEPPVAGSSLARRACPVSGQGRRWHRQRMAAAAPSACRPGCRLAAASVLLTSPRCRKMHPPFSPLKQPLRWHNSRHSQTNARYHMLVTRHSESCR